MAGSEEYGGGFPAFRQSGIPDGSRLVKSLPGGEPADRTGKTSGGRFSHLRHEGGRERSGKLCAKDCEGDGMADVIVLGPGIGMEDYARCMVENVLKDAYVPIILDADALNLAAEYRELTGYFTENIIVTPHMKEMSRLTGIQIEEMKENPVRTAREFADQYGVVCVLKDAATVIAGRDGKTFVNGSGTPAMAKGGSGDVLTGVIAGLVALGLEESDAAALGVYVHGLAGEAAEKHFGVHGVLAGEIADCLPEVYRDGI